MTINNVSNSQIANDLLQNTIVNKSSSDISASNSNNKSFADYLANAIDEVNTDQVKAYGAMRDIALNKTDNLQEAVQKISEAELSLKLALEVQSKAIGAYKEIMRIQV